MDLAPMDREIDLVVGRKIAELLDHIDHLDSFKGKIYGLQPIVSFLKKTAGPAPIWKEKRQTCKSAYLFDKCRILVTGCRDHNFSGLDLGDQAIDLI